MTSGEPGRYLVHLWVIMMMVVVAWAGVSFMVVASDLHFPPPRPRSVTLRELIDDYFIYLSRRVFVFLLLFTGNHQVFILYVVSLVVGQKYYLVFVCTDKCLYIYLIKKKPLSWDLL